MRLLCCFLSGIYIYVYSIICTTTTTTRSSMGSSVLVVDVVLEVIANLEHDN